MQPSLRRLTSARYVQPPALQRSRAITFTPPPRTRNRIADTTVSGWRILLCTAVIESTALPHAEPSPAAGRRYLQVEMHASQRRSCAQGVPLPRVVRRFKLCARRLDGCQRTVQPEAHGGQVAHNRNAHLPRSTSRSMPVAPWNGGALDIKRRTLYSCSSTQEHAGMGMHATNRAYPMNAGHTEPPMSFVVLSCVL